MKEGQQDMVDEQIPANIDKQLDEAVGQTPKSSKKRPPVYKVIGSSKIPVPKSYGKLWKARHDAAVKVNGDLSTAWDEAIRYYENDQTNHRIERDNASGNVRGNQRLNDNITETENIVFANTTTMVPALYSQTPNVEITTDIEAIKEIALIGERLINVLFRRKASPGINLKPKVRRSIITALLTNRAWLMVDWVFKSDSSEQALEDLGKLAEELQKAKTPKKIEEVEGKIMALERSIDILAPSGPKLVYKGPKSVIVDPAAKEIDLTDARWVMIEDMLPTNFLLAKYAKGKADGEQKSVFQPTHVIKIGKNDEDGHEADTFSLFESDSDGSAEAKKFGFDDADAFEKAKMTKVWMVHDKVTRRVLMYNDKDWTWPIWVWDDPYRLDTFFNLFPVTFYDGPSEQFTKGEVVYYLDQQDAINEMNDEERRARRWAFRNVFFDSDSTDRETVESVLKGPDGTARGIRIPEGKKKEDLIFSITTPGHNHRELFDKSSKFAAIDRISSVGEVLRGEQFKTNTTNDAVQANVSASNLKVDDKTDSIEDAIGAVGWAILQMCLQFMTEEEVIALVGESARGVWRNMEPSEISSSLIMQIVGGSSQKPTSQVKKNQALEIGQVLGQFVNSAPGPVLKMMMKVFESAFENFVMKEEDWKELDEAIFGQQQQEQNAGQTNGTDPNAQLQQALAQLPPEAQAAVQDMVSKGVPPEQAIQEVTQAIQGQTAQ